MTEAGRAPAPLVPLLLSGGHALFDVIASGGMGAVHFGRKVGSVGFAKTVAIKRLHPHHAQDAELVEMFVDEARLAARICHPNVVGTIDVVASDGELFLVLEYVHGESLLGLLRTTSRRKEPVPAPIAAAIVSGVLRGLHAAHEARDADGEPLGIVHRDVSPANIIVSADGIPRMLDFGIAKAAGRIHATREGVVKGKTAYMPPEQLYGAIIDRRADVYASGVVLWELLVGKRLFHASTEAATLTRVLNEPVPPPSTQVPGLAAFDDVVMRALSRDVARRFANAQEMALALERCGPVAPSPDVAAWVEANASEVLARRARRVAEIERTPIALSIPSKSSPRELPSLGRTTVLAVAATLVGLAIVTGVYMGWGPRSGAVERDRTAVPATALDPRVAAPIATGAPAEPARAGLTAAFPMPTTAASPATTPPGRPAGIPPRARAKCQPPYTVDVVGHKHFKAECI